MKLNLYISPCPNDTFMFDALVNSRIDTRGIDFDLHFADIEELNRGVASGRNDIHISKISYAVLPKILDRYSLIGSGSALGRGNGPVLVAARPIPETRYGELRVAVPGLHTTANMLLNSLFPQITQKTPYLFSDIADAVLGGRKDAGALIHEGRFTFRQRGLHLLCDLGERWEQVSGLPLPLGAIVASRRLPADVRTAVGELIRDSIRYAFDHLEVSRDFVKEHAREIDDDVIDRHIDMFVNNYSIELGSDGRSAVCRLLGMEEKEVFA